MCRWLERDPAGYQDGPSLYSYLGRNPMAGTDPSGRWVNIVGGAVIGAAIGGIAAAIDGEGWDGIARNAAKGAVVGAVAGATFGIGLAAAGVTTTATVAAAGGLSGMAATATGALLEGRAPTAEELIWGGLFGGATAGTFHGAFGVGRAGLGAIWGKRSAQPGGVARPGPGGAALPEGFTLPVPEEIPSNWIVAPTRSRGGVSFTDPLNGGNEVRVMPGNPKARWPNSRKPYVRWDKDGVPLDVDGSPLPTDKCAPAHIPLEDFRFDPSIFKR